MRRRAPAPVRRPRQSLAAEVIQRVAIQLCFLTIFVLLCYDTAPGEALHPITIDGPAATQTATVHPEGGATP